MKIDLHEHWTGILVPLFALRTENDLGIGDTQAVKEMIDWCQRHHFSVLQLLPINETGDDNSPYNAISSCAIDPTTLALHPDVLPDLTSKDFREIATTEVLKELRQGPVKYRKVKPLKLRLLREAFKQFSKNHLDKSSERADTFRDFVRSQAAWIGDYAWFRSLMELHQGLAVWEDWPLEHRHPTSSRAWLLSLPAEERKAFEDNMLFFCYVQWLAYQQWSDLKNDAYQKGVRLMGDIPFGVSRYSADVWANRHLFDLKWCGGAPPETFFKQDLFTERWGQNWGIPLYRWDRMKEENYSWWRNRVRKTCDIFHIFRIDHVLGFYRIYAFPWKPQDNHLYTHLSQDEVRHRVGDLPHFWMRGDTDDHSKWLNQQQGEELLSIIKEASGESSVIAEDLGVVPDYVRPSLSRLGIPGFKIPLFEREQDGSYKDSDLYPVLSITTPGTHDHQPLAALWQQWASDPSGKSEMNHFLKWMGWQDLENVPHEYSLQLHETVVKKLVSCPSWLMIFMITDVFGQTKRFNIPGPMSEGNWTERMDATVSEFDLNPRYTNYSKILDTLLTPEPAEAKQA